jgi:hypothetical protein
MIYRDFFRLRVLYPSSPAGEIIDSVGDEASESRKKLFAWRSAEEKTKGFRNEAWMKG